MWLRARFESVRALRSPLHTPPVRYFCHCRTHELCCKFASMHVELALSLYLHWRYPACQGRCTCPSGDLSKRALSEARADIPIHLMGPNPGPGHGGMSSASPSKPTFSMAWCHNRNAKNAQSRAKNRFGNQTCVDVLRTEYGGRSVETLLLRLRHGMAA